MKKSPPIETIFTAVTPTKNLNLNPGSPLFRKLERFDDGLTSPSSSLDHLVSSDLVHASSFDQGASFLSPNSAGLYEFSSNSASLPDLNLTLDANDVSELYSNGGPWGATENDFSARPQFGGEGEGAAAADASAAPTKNGGGTTPSAFLNDDPFSFSMDGPSTGLRSKKSSVLTPSFGSPALSTTFPMSSLYRSPFGAPFSLGTPLGGMYNKDTFNEGLRMNAPQPPPVSPDEINIIDEQGKKRPPPLELDESARRVKPKT
mmetsp:Transcript_17241/g.42961  ORF Transcript_17241/g.42961 Transcript_17241/m.42961 type:complete len:261 (-) Transcript_17241:245-1027(-)